ncbi:MAG: hypothetical protein V4591_00150 [Bdellovibrionota bacterium]
MISSNVTAFSSLRKKRKSEEIWYCREGWNGDSRDGQFINGDGYHYFEMKGDGFIQKAYEYYETDDGEERVAIVPELVGINWFSFFGFEDEELLEAIAEHEFIYVEQLLKN